MYKVYWTETRLAHTAEQIASWKEMTNQELDSTATTVFARSETFDTTEMVDAMHFMEVLRKARREHAGISFITLVSEHPDSVGEAGVDSIKNGVCPDGIQYTWMKRRSQ